MISPTEQPEKRGGKERPRHLVALSVEDALKNILYYKTFSYDLEGNILGETEYGNLTGETTTPLPLTEGESPKRIKSVTPKHSLIQAFLVKISSRRSTKKETAPLSPTFQEHQSSNEKRSTTINRQKTHFL